MDKDEKQQPEEGHIVRGPDGRFMAGTQPSNLITSANARELRDRRTSEARQRAQEGAMLAAREWLEKHPGAPIDLTRPLGWLIPIAKAQTDRALSGQRDSTQAARFVAAAAGVPVNDNETPPEGESPISGFAHLVADVLRAVMLSKGEIVEGEVKPVPPDLPAPDEGE